MPYYQYQLFFCLNVRKSDKPCCAKRDAELFYHYAKQQLKKLGLHGPSLCRVNSASCLGRCDEGPILVVYPEGVWYSYKTYTDIDEIIREHIIGGKPVSRLLLSSEPPPSPENK